MPVPTYITDLTSAESTNSPPGTELVGANLDNYLRSHALFINQLYDGVGGGGGFKNKFRNGAFDISQRASVNVPITTGTVAYGPDGWIIGPTGATITWTLANENTSSLLALKLTGATGMTALFVKQRIEACLAVGLKTYDADPVTVQWRIQNVSGASVTPTLTIRRPTTNIDDWSATTTDISAVSLQPCPNNAYTVVSYTFVPNSGIFRGIEAQLDFGAALNSANSIYITHADIQVTVGLPTGLCSNPPPVEKRNIAAEMALCQRYLPGFVFPNGASLQYCGTQACVSTTGGRWIVQFPVPTRADITGVTGLNTTDFKCADANGSGLSFTAMSFGSGGNQFCLILTTVAAGLAPGVCSLVLAQSNSARLIFTGAEL